VHTRLSAKVDHREQEIAQLSLQGIVSGIEDRWCSRFGRCRVTQLLSNFLKLLFNLHSRTIDIGPVESDSSRAILQPMRAMQCWQ
jgi:hypothetical protein